MVNLKKTFGLERSRSSMQRFSLISQCRFHFDTGFVCMGNTIALGLISSYFTRYYNAATNTITTALPLAVMVSAPLTQFLIDIYGWRGTVLLFSGLILHYIAAAAVLKPSKQIKSDEKGISYKPLTSESDNVQGCKSRNMLSLSFEAMWNVTLFKKGRFPIVLVVSIVAGYMLNGWVVYLVSIAQSKGLSPTDAANVATISGVGAVLIRIILAILRDKTSYRHLFLIGLVLSVVSYGGMYFANSFWLLSLCGLTVGISYGILGTQPFIAANDIVEEENAMAAVAWVSLTHGLGYIISGYVSGKFINFTSRSIVLLTVHNWQN